MTQQKKRLSIIAGIVLIALAAVLLIVRNNMTPEVLAVSQAPIDAKEITFEKSLMITADSMGIDAAELKVVPCESTPQVFGLIKIDHELMGELTCSTDYLGGVKLQYTDRSGGKETLDLAQQEGDAGDLWDARSLLTRSSDGSLVIETMLLSSSESMESANTPASCSVRQETLAWDSATQTFIPNEGPGEFFLSRFLPPINVVNDCLDNKGAWRGSSN